MNYEYYKWKYGDRGHEYHPKTARWVAVHKSSILERGSEAALRSAIDARRQQYPNSTAAIIDAPQE